jgi:PPOX class probable F420-dependent enzyme
MLDPDVRRVLDGTSLGHLATVLPDGSPHTTPVFVGTHGDQLIFFTGPRSRKARNLRRDPRVALSLAPADYPFQPVIIRGRVTERLEGDTAWEIIDQIAAKYTGQPYTRDSTHRRRRRARPAEHRHELNRLAGSGRSSGLGRRGPRAPRGLAEGPPLR